MLKDNKYLLLALIGLLILESCAKRGRPSGGPKDEDAPLYVTADPPYETTNFDKDEIKIEFNEFITLKDLSKQLVVSPPLKNNPIITPQGTPSKYIEIEILDTLQENTTYIFDFGKSVQDNNEGNQLKSFKYVFSTGTYIDSLFLNGSVTDAFEEKAPKNIKLLLFRADSTYRDSLLYKQKPDYVSSTLDTAIFRFSNLASGKFRVFALEDFSSDYIFDPKFDKIGFLDTIISLPKDSILLKPLRLFKEVLPYKFVRGKEEKKGKILLSYQGKLDDFKVVPLSKVEKNFRSFVEKEKSKDTLNYWFHNYKQDSIILQISNKKFIDTAVVFLRKDELDTLKIDTQHSRYLEFLDTLFLVSNNPIYSLDTSKIQLFDKDTVAVKKEAYISKDRKRVAIEFKKEYSQRYQLKILPEVVEDLYGFKNDSLSFIAVTKKLEDYGDITLSISNPKNKNLIVQLIDSKNLVLREEKINTSKSVSFKYLKPKVLKARIIIDENKNGKWDTGDFLNKIQPEYIYYHNKEFEVRANWSLNENITIN